MAAITDGYVRVYKGTGPGKEEKLLFCGPISPSALDILDRETSTGSAYYFKQGVALDQDQWLIITFYHATKVSANASLLLMITGLINFKSLEGRIRTQEWNLTEGTTNITKTDNTAGVETEIVVYQIPRDVSVAIRAGDQFYLYLAE